MRFPAIACLLCLFSPVRLSAQEAPASPVPSQEKQGKIDIPVPMGQEIKGIKIPSFNDKGELTMEFQAETAMKEQEHLLKMKNLTIIVIDPDDKTRTDVHMEDAVFNLDTRILSTKNQTIIRRDDAEIIGDSAEFDTKTRFSRMEGNVKMTISDLDHYNP